MYNKWLTAHVFGYVRRLMVQLNTVYKKYKCRFLAFNSFRNSTSDSSFNSIVVIISCCHIGEKSLEFIQISVCPKKILDKHRYASRIPKNNTHIDILRNIFFSSLIEILHQQCTYSQSYLLCGKYRWVQ